MSKAASGENVSFRSRCARNNIKADRGFAFRKTYLHDELDRADEEAEELENEVLLLLPRPNALAIALAGPIDC
jgi:hypothetical protein